jgi:hypothetical protein
VLIRFVVDVVIVDFDVGYRWGWIVNRHDVLYVALDYYEKHKLVKELPSLRKPKKWKTDITVYK